MLFEGCERRAAYAVRIPANSFTHNHETSVKLTHTL